MHRIEQAHGIKIGYGAPAEFWTPPFKPKDATAPGVTMQPAELRNVAIAVEGIGVALDQYPPGFVAHLIRAIFICGELRMGGEEAGGTAAPAWIVLANLARLARQHPLIRRKLDFVLAAYVAIDPRLADQFRRIGLDGTAAPSRATKNSRRALRKRSSR